jgi:hypothetical protein
MQTRMHVQVSSKWREALVVALCTVHPNTCLVSVIGRPSYMSAPLYTITKTRYDAVDELHAGTLPTLLKVI